MSFTIRMVRSIVFLALCGWCTACGGGTQGTGTGPSTSNNRVYEGIVRSAMDQHPLANVVATIEESGDSAVSDENGQFEIENQEKTERVTLLLEGTNFHASVSLNDIPEESSRVSAEIEVDTDHDTAEVNHFSAKVGIVGLCDYYFENREVIRQANRVPFGTECTINMFVLGDGKPVGNIPIALQVKACKPNSIWETLETTTTGIGKFRGTAQITFPFVDSVDTCRYRVLLPFKFGHAPTLEYLIETFTAQEEKD